MKSHRAAVLGVIVAVSLVAVSCGERAPLAPPARTGAPELSLGSSLLHRLTGTLGLDGGLVSCSPLPYDSVTETIGPAGGTLDVGPHELVVPPAALQAPTAITAVVPSDTVNVVRFQPQGLQFMVPAHLTLSYANCATGGAVPGHIAYVSDLLAILESLVAHREGEPQTVTGLVSHFSGYAVAW